MVAKHLVMVGRLLEEDPAEAWRHAAVARSLAGRVAPVREAAAVAAYRAGEYAVALSELRTARRLTGSAEYLPLLADCERALGRPSRALEYLNDPSVAQLDSATKVELLIVVAGARIDLEQPEVAVQLLHVPALHQSRPAELVARLRSAYADALSAAGHQAEAVVWLAKAAELDPAGETGAAERLGGQPGPGDLEIWDLDPGDEPEESGGTDASGGDASGSDTGGTDAGGGGAGSTGIGDEGSRGQAR